MPPFASVLPQGEPAAFIVVSAEALRQAAAGQEGFVRLNHHSENQGLELAGAGKYVPMMPALGVP
jgi:hypothetical protein